MIEGDYREGVEVAGIGSGKRFRTDTACYSVHQFVVPEKSTQNLSL